MNLGQFKDAYVLHGYEEAADKTNIFYWSPFEELKGYLAGNSPEEVIKTWELIHPCTCSETPVAFESECMGDFDFTISCPNCGRKVTHTMYDYECKGNDGYITKTIEDWNNGLNQQQVREFQEQERDKRKITEDHIQWKDLYPNNMPGNGHEGYYTILLKEDGEAIRALKWTIKFQPKEESPMISAGGIDLYNLFVKVYPRVVGNLEYPAPTDDMKDFNFNDKVTFSKYGVNDVGEFIRSYRTLNEAKLGARARCGQYGFNALNIMRKEEEHE